jgi:hypothetical protein
MAPSVMMGRTTAALLTSNRITTAEPEDSDNGDNAGADASMRDGADGGDDGNGAESQTASRLQAVF